MGRYNVPEDADSWVNDKFFDVDGEYYDDYGNGYVWSVRLTGKKFTTGTYNIMEVGGGGAWWVFYGHAYDSEVEQNFEDLPGFQILTAPA
jgi:hypothetical protein